MSDIEKAFKLACRYIADIADCPIEHGWHHPEGCDNVCGNVDIAECWRLYFSEPDWETIGKCKDCKWWEKVEEMLVEDMGFCNRENTQFYYTHEDFSCIHWARRNKDDTEV